MPARGSVPSDVACLVLRVVLGPIMIPHGMQKLFGSSGGSGLEKRVDRYVGFEEARRS